MSELIFMAGAPVWSAMESAICLVLPLFEAYMIRGFIGFTLTVLLVKHLKFWN